MGCDITDWGIGASLGVTWRNRFGVDVHLGPFWAYWSCEWGMRMYIDGKDTESGVGPV
jgi:hypothetical protein